MAKTFYYKLSSASSIFYDPKNKLKVTKGVPGKTDNRTKQTMEAERSGHIVNISDVEYNNMLNLLPEKTKEAILKDHKEVPKKVEPKKEVPKVEEEEEENEESSDEREGLIERLKSLGLSKKEYKKVSEYSDEDLEAYLIDNE